MKIQLGDGEARGRVGVRNSKTTGGLQCPSLGPVPACVVCECVSVSEPYRTLMPCRPAMYMSATNFWSLALPNSCQRGSRGRGVRPRQKEVKAKERRCPCEIERRRREIKE